ncbi:MAG: PEP/pyruvate-binding domain-containing protein [Gemmatimonadota bacterium]
MTGERDRDETLDAPQRRARELSCLYRVVEVLGRADLPPHRAYQEVVEALPAGWRYPGICRAELTVGEEVYTPEDFSPTPWAQHAEIRVQGRAVGRLSVYYGEEVAAADEGPFLKEERQLLEMLAERIGFYILQRDPRRQGPAAARPASPRWRVVLPFMERMDPRLLQWITRKMLNHLRWKGVAEARELLPTYPAGEEPGPGEENRPLGRAAHRETTAPTDEVFRLAGTHCTEEEILSLVQMWISQDRVRFLIGTLEDQASSFADITDALERFTTLGVREEELPRSVQTMLRVALLRRFFTDDIDFINIAKELVSLTDFQGLARRLLHAANSHGKLGGKAAGLFLAHRVVEASAESAGALADVRVPRTWYIASDSVLAFLRFNHLEEVYDRKYLDLDQVRQQYPNIVEAFRASSFPPELVKGMSAALEDLGEGPIIVRSSSLLEDQSGAAFSGKYKSLFLANRGTRQERLRALQDAVAEVYASIFSPDPIEYRAERNLLDVHEEMGIMIQEVVGTAVGPYFLPSFSGVAVNNNELRWSSRIRREDGLLRMVPGLGTRAVDRLVDDYPVLLSPGQPGLRVNTTAEETLRYAPRMLDVIDLEGNAFGTVPVADLLRGFGDRLPLMRKIVSVLEDGRLRPPRAGGLAAEEGQPLVTFEGLATETPFLARMATLLAVLRARFGVAVEVEFAHDGRHLYLLQCRPQSYPEAGAPALIPRNVPPDRVLLRARRHVSNGRVPHITHLVYVDPDAYALLPDVARMRAVGQAVSRLNTLLPRRRFILMGPGRWGSRGDIRLGVSVTYSDVNNAAVLVEIARQREGYAPDLSFGTHFFQDLVEAEIRYLPLYPDEEDGYLAEDFLRGARNLLPVLLPDMAELADVVRVVDVGAERPGQVLSVLMDGEEEEALGYFTPAAPPLEADLTGPHLALERVTRTPRQHDHAHWRYRVAEQLAARVDAARQGVRGLWLVGSAYSGTATAASAIDLVVRFQGTPEARRELEVWLDGWSRALAAANYLRTGVRMSGLLDVRWVREEDVPSGSGPAAGTGAPADPARRLRLGNGGTGP